jgi:hypothetical protein
MKEATVLGVIGGAAVLAIIGFTWAGSLTESTRKVATERADTARRMGLQLSAAEATWSLHARGASLL